MSDKEKLQKALDEMRKRKEALDEKLNRAVESMRQRHQELEAQSSRQS